VVERARVGEQCQVALPAESVWDGSMVRWFDGSMVDWDGGMVGWWDGGMVGLSEKEMRIRTTRN
jgi:hypothetical protein